MIDRIEILSIGSELVDGRTVDSNSAHIARALKSLGYRVAAFHQVGDDMREITDAMRLIASRADFCICTGGLGPTRDDLTREAVALVSGNPPKADLVEHEPSLTAIRRRFEKYGREMPASNACQAMFPAGARVLANSIGTAPGFIVAVGDCQFACLPGVPREMRLMLKDELIPALLEISPPQVCIKSRELKLFGITESSLADRLGDLMDRDKNPSVGTSATDGVISIIVRSTAHDAATAENGLTVTEDKIRALVGDYIFGEGDATLEGALAAELARHGKTIATAESCTGGLIGAMLTNVPGISAHFLRGAICYGNAAKTEMLGVEPELLAAKGAVSEEVARALAEGARRTAGADIGVGVTGIAGPGGGSEAKPVGLVYIAVADAEGTVAREFRFAGDRVIVRERAARTAINMVLKRLGG